jgi:hypothetical protein
MTQAKGLILGVAVAALTFGLTGKPLSIPPQEEPLSDSDIVVVLNDSGQAAGSAEEKSEDGAKVNEVEGTHAGARQGGPPDSRAPKLGSDNSASSDQESQKN